MDTIAENQQAYPYSWACLVLGAESDALGRGDLLTPLYYVGLHKKL